MKDLYEVDSEYSRILEDIMAYAEENEGVISEELEKTLEFAEINIEETGKKLKNIESEIDMIKAEESNLAERRKKCERRAEGIKEFLASFMGKNKFKCGAFEITAHVDRSLKYSTESLKIIPEEYQREVVKREIDKEKVRQLAEAGEQFSFCRWVEKKRVK
jgi:hypothetical protein